MANTAIKDKIGFPDPFDSACKYRHFLEQIEDEQDLQPHSPATGRSFTDFSIAAILNLNDSPAPSHKKTTLTIEQKVLSPK